MTTFDNREQAYEAKFARDQELEFRINSRRNRLLGAWAAERMGLPETEAQAYAEAVIHAEFEDGGDEDVVRKLLGDLTAAGIETDEAQVRAAMAEQAAEARRQLTETR